MTLVVTQPCQNCKYTDCVTVCPTDAFYQDDRMLYINPDDCIDCGACEPECPVEAIYSESDVPAGWAHYIELNRERAAGLIASGARPLTEKQEPLEGSGCGRK